MIEPRETRSGILLRNSSVAASAVLFVPQSLRIFDVEAPAGQEDFDRIEQLLAGDMQKNRRRLGMSRCVTGQRILFAAPFVERSLPAARFVFMHCNV